MKTKKELLIEAQDEQLGEIAKLRIALLKASDDLEDFGGTDDYTASLSAIVSHYGEKGISSTRTRLVLPDPVLLKKAIEQLVKDGKILEAENGRASILKPVKALTPVPMEANS